MLKIKDNVDMKEFEKFEDLEYRENKYFKNPYYVNNSGTVFIWKKSRHLDLIGCSNVRNEYDLLFDLIKADMIEKVVKHE